MNTRLVRNIVLVCMIVLNAAGLTPAYSQANTADPNAKSDFLTQWLSDSCVAVMRINHFQTSLTAMDQYLAGASPLPVSLAMMATIQMTSITGDPALTGIDMEGDFGVAAVKLPQDQTDELFMAFMIPTTGHDAFLKANKNITGPDSSGMYLLDVENSPLGKMVLLPVKDSKYLIASREQSKSELQAFQTLVQDKKSTLADKLDKETLKKAVQSPAWVWFNIDLVHQLYNETLTSAMKDFQEAMSELQPGTAHTQKMQMAMTTEMLQFVFGQADSFNLSLNFNKDTLLAETTLQAKAGTELAAMLRPARPAYTGFALTDKLGNSAAVNMLMHINKPVFEKLTAKMMDILAASMEDKPDTAFKELSAKAIANITDGAIAFSYTSQAPYFEFEQYISLADPNTFKPLMIELVKQTNILYQKMNFPIQLAFIANAEKIQNTAIDRFEMKPIASKDPNDAMAKMMTQMYGEKGLQYYGLMSGKTYGLSTSKDKLAAMAGGKSYPVPADITLAMSSIPDASKADAILSANLLKLAKGMSDMTSTMASRQKDQDFKMPNFWEGIDTQTLSCMSVGAFIEEGQVRKIIALPKQHLREVVQAVMLVQQKAIGYYTSQAAANKPQMPEIMEETDATEDDPLQKYVGTAVPSLTLTDIDGKAFDLTAQKGKPVMLIFWATWCPPCKKEIPALKELRAAYKEEQLAMIAISSEPVSKIQPFAKDNQLNYRVASYADALPAPFNEIQYIPVVFLIDREGKIKSVLSGEISFEDFKAAIEKMGK